MSRAWSVGGVVGLLCFVSSCGQPPGGNSASPTSTSNPGDQGVNTATADGEAANTATEIAPGNATEAASTSTPAAVPAWRTEIQLTDGTWADTEDLIAEHRGKVVVMDVWSTACEPCLRELPHLVELQERFPDTLVCVAVNSDYAGVRKKPPEYYRDRVFKVLESKQAKVINVLCTEPADELFTQLKIDSIPAVFVYNRDGELAAKFDHKTTNMGDFTYAEHVEPMVLRLLAGDTASAELTPAAP
ncbi:MAG TPA: TlpA disulfide reductase family protein [Planctomycetaceae bacterium]|nr:TlpA disulfide reductase family protein [Planctomycetaceae bacterium]